MKTDRHTHMQNYIHTNIHTFDLCDMMRQICVTWLFGLWAVTQLMDLCGSAEDVPKDIYICMYIYIYICVRKYMYMYIHTYIYIHICTCRYAYIHIYTHTYSWMCVISQMMLRKVPCGEGPAVQKDVRKYTCTYMYVYMYVYI